MKLKILLLIFTIIISCRKYDAENLKGYIEYGLESENYVRWSSQQSLTWEDFHGDADGNGIYYDYFGIYFFYDLSEGLKFNATIYFDREKSWARPREEWEGHQEQFQKLLNLKFDYYELMARQLRKELIENSDLTSNEEFIRRLPQNYFDRATDELQQFRDQLDYDRIDQQIDSLQHVVDLKLKELEKFDTRVNLSF